jgi:hypothetical protein
MKKGMGIWCLIVILAMLFVGSGFVTTVSAGNTISIDNTRISNEVSNISNLSNVSPRLIELTENNPEKRHKVLILLKDGEVIKSLKSSKTLSYKQRKELAKSSAYIQDIKESIGKYGEFQNDMICKVRGEEEKRFGEYIFFLNALKMEVPVKNVEKIAKLPFVKSVWDAELEMGILGNNSVKLANNTNKSKNEIEGKSRYYASGTWDYWEYLKSKNWGIWEMEIDRLHDRGYKGEFTYSGDWATVGVIDTGIDTDHPVYNPYWDGAPWEEGKLNVVGVAHPYFVDIDDYDPEGHGTADAGVVWEIAPTAHYFILKVENIGQYSSAIDWCLLWNLNVITSSLGSKKDSWGAQDLAEKASDAVNSDTTFVVAAGNREKFDYPASPSIGEKVLSISSYYYSDLHPSGCPYYTYNGKPDL